MPQVLKQIFTKYRHFRHFNTINCNYVRKHVMSLVCHIFKKYPIIIKRKKKRKYLLTWWLLRQWNRWNHQDGVYGNHKGGCHEQSNIIIILNVYTYIHWLITYRFITFSIFQGQYNEWCKYLLSIVFYTTNIPKIWIKMYFVNIPSSNPALL